MPPWGVLRRSSDRAAAAVVLHAAEIERALFAFVSAYADEPTPLSL